MKGLKNWKLQNGLILVYEDRDLMIVDKPPGLLTIGTLKEKTKTVHFILSEYLSQGRGKGKIFVVHRLDRETSGLLVFAKSEKIKYSLQENWDKVKKKYLAIIAGKIEPKNGVFESLLAENDAHVVYATGDPLTGKPAKTEYRVLKESKSHSLLEINLHTGRKHQIRVHLADAGFPVIGDQKYGIKDKNQKRLALHAYSLEFDHPFSGKSVKINSEIPGIFQRMFGDYFSKTK